MVASQPCGLKTHFNLFSEGRRNSAEMESMKRVQILDETACFALRAQALEKDMNLSLLSPELWLN